MILLEDIYIDLLLEGKSPEEIKALLHYKFDKSIPSDIIDKTVDIDPTAKKSYSMWALTRYEKEPNRYVNALKDGRLKKFFDYAKSKTDIQPTSFRTLKDAFSSLGEDEILLNKDEGSSDENDFDIVYDTPEWKIAVPNTYEAACKLGRDTRWCTANAYGNGLSYYRDYAGDGKLFVNFDMRQKEHRGHTDYPFKRYQFHFERNAFLDANDEHFDIKDADIPQGVFDFYNNEGYDASKIATDEEELREDYENIRFNDGFYIFENNDIIILREYNNEYHWEGDEGDFDYYVYDADSDIEDPIVYTPVSKSGVSAKSQDGDNWAVIPARSGEGYVLIYYDNKAASSFRKWCGIDVDSYIVDGNSLIFVDSSTEWQGAKQTTTVTLNITNNGVLISVPIDGIPNAHDVDMVKSQITDGEHVFVEIVRLTGNGLHTLFKIGKAGEVTQIIKGDLPIDGDYFTLSEDGFIHGEVNTYSINGDASQSDNSGNRISKLVSRVGNTNYVVVELMNGQQNLFNKENGKLVFKNGFNEIKSFNDCDKIVAGRFDKEAPNIAIYSLDGQKLSSDGISYGYDITTGALVFQLPDKKIVMFTKDMKQVGPFDSVIARGNGGRNILVKYGKLPRTINVDTGEIGLKWAEGYRTPKYFGILLTGTEIVCFKGGKEYLVNYATEKILSKPLNPTKDELPEEIEIGNRAIKKWWLCRFENNYSNIISSDGENVFGEDMIDVHVNSRKPDYIVGNNGRRNFVYWTLQDRFVPTENGLNPKQCSVDPNKGEIKIRIPQELCGDDNTYAICDILNGNILNYKSHGQYGVKRTPEIDTYIKNVVNGRTINENKTYRKMNLMEDIFDDIMAAHPEWNTDTIEDINEKYAKEDDSFDDKKGNNYKIEPPYAFYSVDGSNMQADFIHPFHNDMAIADRNGLKTFINKDGKMVVEEWFKNANDFEDGFGLVRRRSGKCNFVSNDGQFLLSNDVDRASDFMNGVAMVIDGGRRYQIGTDGKEI